MKRDWRADAACRGMDTDLFFPVSRRGIRRAVAVCKPCPVRLECLEYASVTGVAGIWGGLTEEQRRDSRLCRRLRAGVLAS